MSAAERARFARAARAVLGPEADRAGGRFGRLRRQQPRSPASFADLDAVPTWLPDDLQARDRFVAMLGIAAVAPRLRAVIDGAVLRKIADQVGPDLVDWGLGLSASEADSLSVEPNMDVRAYGHAVLQHSLPVSATAWFPTSEKVDPQLANEAIDQARAGVA